MAAGWVERLVRSSSKSEGGSDTHHRSCVIDGFRRVSHRAPIRATVGSTQGEEYTMKLVYFDDFKLGVLKGDPVVDVVGGA